MKKLLLDAYRILVPAPIKRLIPAGVKAFGLGVAYRLTGYPDLRLWQMRHLYRSGSKGWLTKDIDDPLLTCSVQPAILGSASTGSPSGQFYVEFGFLGLKVKGRLTDPKAAAAGHVNLCLDGKLLRRIGVQSANGKGAKILFTIRRPSLAMFPQMGRLSVADVSGRPLSVDLRGFPGQKEATGASEEIDLRVPFGDGQIFEHLAATGPLDKKGWPRLTEVQAQRRQQQMLELYGRVRDVFQRELDRPLFLLYGTLLGQVRTGDFIPGDDDFDVGYVSEATTPADIKTEATMIMEKLVANGFIVALNHLGRPHRVRDALSGGVEIHLDNHIVFSMGDDHVWMHPRAKLPLSLDLFRAVEPAKMGDCDVLIPSGAEEFLAAYYGPGWQVPDPGYANIITASDPVLAKRLASICLTRTEQRALADRLAKQGLPGDFVAQTLEQPYPIERWAQRVGF